MAARNSTGTSRAVSTSFDLKAVDTHFSQLRGDLDGAHKVIVAASAYLEMVDFMKKDGSLREETDYLNILRTILKDANGMITAAGVEWTEVDALLPPVTEVANHD